MPYIDVENVFKNREREKEHVENEKQYSKKETLDILYRELTPIYEVDDKVVLSNKYTKLAKDYKYDNYRLCTYMNIVNLGLEKSVAYYVYSFVKKCGATVAIFNILDGKPISVTFRSLSEKEFRDYSLIYNIYGFDLIDSNFKYGDYLIITEGFYDADSLRVLYPNVVATQTSNVNSMQAEVLKTMTDKFIIAYDDDSAGEAGFKKALNKLGTDIKKLSIYPEDKDVGRMEEVKYDRDAYEKRKEYYLKEIVECKEGYGFSL